MKKKLVVCILCGMMAMSALTCGIGSVFAAESPETPVISAQEGEQIPNPWKEYTSVKDAENAVGFSVKLPKKISGYTKDMIQAVDGLVLQVFYKSGDKEILIRKALVSQGKDISGDYNVYDVTKKVSVKGKKRKVTIKGTEKKKNLAVWSDGTYSYSLYTSAGMSQKALIRLVKQYNRSKDMVICLERAISWQERLHAAAADCWRICRQHLLQMAVKQEKQDERAAVNQKAEELLKDYGNSILRMAYAYLHNMSDAEDILQETLIQYLQTAPVLENPAHEKAWLLKVAANLSKNRIDYNRIRQTDELEETLVAEKREDLRFVWEAVRALPEK